MVSLTYVYYCYISGNKSVTNFLNNYNPKLATCLNALLFSVFPSDPVMNTFLLL